MQQSRPGGMRIFIIIWIGQIISLLGTGMTNFGLPIWVFEQSGRATDLTTIAGLYVASLLIVSPFSGVLIDRSNRKLMMMLSDLAAGLVTLGVLILFSLFKASFFSLKPSLVLLMALESSSILWS